MNTPDPANLPQDNPESPITTEGWLERFKDFLRPDGPVDASVQIKPSEKARATAVAFLEKLHALGRTPHMVRGHNQGGISIIFPCTLDTGRLVIFNEDNPRPSFLAHYSLDANGKFKDVFTNWTPETELPPSGEPNAPQ